MKEAKKRWKPAAQDNKIHTDTGRKRGNIPVAILCGCSFDSTGVEWHKYMHMDVRIWETGI